MSVILRFLPEESFLFRYFANAQYDVVLEIFGGICYINPLVFVLTLLHFLTY